MPINKYFDGSGEKVMKSMKKQYGEKKGEQIFYATENKSKKGEIDTGPSRNLTKKHKVD